MQVRSLLRQKFPDLHCVGTPYPVPLQKVLLSRLVTVVQLSILAVTMFGDRLFSKLEDAPEFIQSLSNNKFGICMMVWFVGNILSQNLTNTGAFEIAFDGHLIFSKMGSNRMPTVQEIMGGVEKHMRHM